MTKKDLLNIAGNVVYFGWCWYACYCMVDRIRLKEREQAFKEGTDKGLETGMMFGEIRGMAKCLSNANKALLDKQKGEKTEEISKSDLENLEETES